MTVDSPAAPVAAQRNVCIIPLDTTNTHRIKPWNPGHMRGTSGNWCVKVRDWGALIVSQRWASSIGMQPNAMLIFNNHSGVQIDFLGYFWIIRNVDQNV